MTADPQAPRTCAHCGGPVPKRNAMKIVNPRIGFSGVFCDKPACEAEAWKRAQDFGGD